MLEQSFNFFSFASEISCELNRCFNDTEILLFDEDPTILLLEKKEGEKKITPEWDEG